VLVTPRFLTYFDGGYTQARFDGVNYNLAVAGGGPCVDGSKLARTFFTRAALVGAAMCSGYACGSRDRWP
jgi:hypothetical protein